MSGKENLVKYYPVFPKRTLGVVLGMNRRPDAAADPAEAQLVEQDLAFVEIFRPPGEPYRRHLAPGIGRRLDLAAELAEAIHLQHGRIDGALLEAFEGLQLAVFDAKSKRLPPGRLRPRTTPPPSEKKVRTTSRSFTMGAVSDQRGL